MYTKTNTEMIEELRAIYGNTITSIALNRHNPEYYARAKAGELVRGEGRGWIVAAPGAMNSSYQVDTENEPSVSSEEQREAKKRDIEKRFDMLAILADGVIGGNIRSLMIAGAPGVGKTHTLEEKLRIAEQAGDISYCHIKGSMSSIKLYEELYNHKDENAIVLLDDVDVFKNEESLNLLKSVLDTSKVRNVSWKKLSRYLEESGIPDTFSFCGSVVFLTNKNPDRIIEKDTEMSAHWNALMSRSVFLDLAIHDAESILLRIEQIVQRGQIVHENGLTDHQSDEIMEFIRQHYCSLRSLSLRSYVQLAGFIKSAPIDWADIAEMTMIKRR